MSETVTLTGDALYGVGTADSNRRLHLGDPLPAAVKLGRIAPKARPQALRLGAYFHPERAVPLPASINRREKAAKSLARMYMNDRYGCCVFSGKAHALGLWSVVDAEVPEVEATDKEITDQYFAYTGGRDVGAIIYEVLDYMRTKGFQAGGVRHKIDGYVSVDNTNKELVKAAQYIFGATSIGIDLPREWTNSAVWDVTSSRSVGGHDVTPIDYDERGVYVSSWGRVYLMTWAAFLSRRYVGEYYAILAPLWYGADKKAAAHGIDVQALLADLGKLDDGVIPDIDPVGPPPPPQPVPPHPEHKLYTCTVSTHEMPAWVLGPAPALETALGDRYGKLTPEQIAAIIAAIQALIEAFNKK